MTDKFKNTASVVFILTVLYCSISCAGFMWRNPTANAMQCWRYPWSVLTWQRLPQFQECHGHKS